MIKYFIVGYFLINIAYVYVLGILFDNKLEKQLKETDEEQFEIRQRRFYYFRFIAYALLLTALYIASYQDNNTYDINRISLLAFCITAIIWSVWVFIRKSRERIVYDRGRIVSYRGRTINASGTIYEIKMAQGVAPYIVVFDNDEIIRVNYTMYNSYKLVAILMKNGYFKENNLDILEKEYEDEEES